MQEGIHDLEKVEVMEIYAPSPDSENEDEGDAVG